MPAILIIPSLLVAIPLVLFTVLYVEDRGWRSLWRKLWEYGSVGAIIVLGGLGFIGLCMMALAGW